MKKNINFGYMLVETLLVTIFVAGVLIFLFIEFSNLDNSYEISFKYNTVENLYALGDIRDYIQSNKDIFNQLKSKLENNNGYIENCDFSNDEMYCAKLLNLENIEQLVITENSFNKSSFPTSDEEFINFINKISADGDELYRLIASFKDSKGNRTYATLKFGL